MIKTDYIDSRLVTGHLYLAGELSKLLGVSRRTVYRQLKKHRVRRLKLWGLTVFSEAELKDKLWDTKFGRKQRRKSGTNFWRD